MRRSAAAIGTTSLTDAIAFFSNTLSPVPAVRNFGYFVGLAILMNFMILVLIYPASILILHRRSKRRHAQRGSEEEGGDSIRGGEQFRQSYHEAERAITGSPDLRASSPDRHVDNESTPSSTWSAAGPASPASPIRPLISAQTSSESVESDVADSDPFMRRAASSFVIPLVYASRRTLMALAVVLAVSAAAVASLGLEANAGDYRQTAFAGGVAQSLREYAHRVSICVRSPTLRRRHEHSARARRLSDL